jgi:hypothetical protein
MSSFVILVHCYPFTAFGVSTWVSFKAFKAFKRSPTEGHADNGVEGLKPGQALPEM